MSTQINENIGILIVEDDDVDAKAIERALRGEHINNPIHRACDGLEAIDFLKNDTNAQNNRFILLIDINMPRMGGLKLLRILRQDPDLSRNMAIVVSGVDSDEHKFAAYDLNIAGYIDKNRAGKDVARLSKMINRFWNEH